MKTTLTTIAVLFTIVSAVIAADHYLAKSSELYAVNLRLDYKINQDIRNDILTQIYEIEKQHGTNPALMPELIAKRYKELQATLKQVENALEQIRNVQLKKGG